MRPVPAGAAKSSDSATATERRNRGSVSGGTRQPYPGTGESFLCAHKFHSEHRPAARMEVSNDTSMPHFALRYFSLGESRKS